MFDVFEDYWLISLVFYVLKTSDVDALRLLSLQWRGRLRRYVFSGSQTK